MNLNETVDFYIKSAWHSLTRMYNQLALQNGFSQAIGYVLIHIEREGTPATKIAPLMGMEPTSLSRLLQKMEIMGLIYKEIDNTDKRVVRIYLTEEGNQKRKLAKQTIIAFNERLLEVIDARKIAQLNETLRNIKDFVQEEIDQINETKYINQNIE
jgi:MarR family transcriptional regulator, organic hydroperoxide resistance regulator